MPIYEVQCQNESCKKKKPYEVQSRYIEGNIVGVCAECGHELHKTITAPNVGRSSKSSRTGSDGNEVVVQHQSRVVMGEVRADGSIHEEVISDTTREYILGGQEE